MTTTQNTPAAVRQWLLPRQVAAPVGPVDVKMMYVMHHAFRRDLVMFAAAAAATPAGDADTWVALAERWRVFSTILHHHHSGEDAGLWPRLMQDASPREQTTLEAMEAEHAEIDPILTACATGFQRVTSGTDPMAAAFLAGRLAAARDTLLAHMGHEETEAMALVQKHLTQADWDHVVEQNFDKNMPAKELLAAIPWIAHELPRYARDELLEEAGLPMRLLWLATRRRFARLDARATRHLAQPGG
jgi:hemerythrin-like domain-containing protein